MSTVTGNLRLIQNRQSIALVHHARYSEQESDSKTHLPLRCLPDSFEHWDGPATRIIDDLEVIKKIGQYKNGRKFLRLQKGDISEYNDDHSAADMAYISFLVFALGSDIERIDRIMRKSGLMRDKWDSPRKDSTYGRRTIIKAIQFYVQRNAPNVGLFENLEAELESNQPANLQLVRDGDTSSSEQTQPTEDRFKFVAAQDLELKPVSNYLIKGLLLEQSLIVLYGPSNSGKTFSVLDICLFLSRGDHWNGLKTRKCTVAYVAEEGGAGVRNRVLAYRKAHGITKDDHMSFHLLDDHVDLRSPDYDLNDLIVAIDKVHTRDSPLIIVIDTLARAMAGADENAGDAMALMLKAVDKLQRNFGAAVMLIHHTGKNTSAGERGHSSLRAACETSILIEKIGDDGIRMKVMKQRDLEGRQEFHFKLEKVVLGTDSDGDSITSCVVRSNSSEDVLDEFDVLDDPVDQLTPQARKAYQSLNKKRQELFLVSSVTGPDKGGSMEMPMVTKEKLISFLTDAHLANSPDNSDSHRTAAIRVLKVLLKHKILIETAVGDTCAYHLYDEQMKK